MTQTRPEWPFYAGLGLLGGTYVVLVAALLVADVLATTPGHLLEAFRAPDIRAALRLSLVSSALSTLLAMWAAVPLGYLLARVPFPGRGLVELLADVPLVLPPLVIGLSLLLLSQTPVGRALSLGFPVAYEVPAVVVAQFAVTAAYATRAARLTFAQLSPRAEEVARVLGCTRGQAFWLVTLPAARPGLVAAGTLAWARSLGEFGPVLVFAGVTRFKTEVLPTAVYLELAVGRLEAAVAVSLLLVGVAVVVLAGVRLTAGRGAGV